MTIIGRALCSGLVLAPRSIHTKMVLLRLHNYKYPLEVYLQRVSEMRLEHRNFGHITDLWHATFTVGVQPLLWRHIVQVLAVTAPNYMKLGSAAPFSRFWISYRSAFFPSNSESLLMLVEDRPPLLERLQVNVSRSYTHHWNLLPGVVVHICCADRSFIVNFKKFNSFFDKYVPLCLLNLLYMGLGPLLAIFERSSCSLRIISLY